VKGKGEEGFVAEVGKAEEENSQEAFVAEVKSPRRFCC